MLALSAMPNEVMAQRGERDLPRTIKEAGERLRNRSVSVTELIKTYINGAKQLGPKLNPFITLTEEEALKTAAVLEVELGQGSTRGPLHGIPIVYKDNIDTAGTLTTVGSEYFNKRVPDTDAHVVALLKRAGAVIIAKANMNEFAAGVAGRNKHFGDARNPWDPNRWPGGSSSGTGVAIASGLCLGGLGTDTGISVRGPAGWLGLVGVRPSYGRVSVRGVFPRAYSLDTVGPLAHTVADAATLLQAISDYDEKDNYAVKAPASDFSATLANGVKGLRLGIVDDFTYRNIDPEVGKAVQASVDLFGKLGAEIKTVKIPLLSGKIDFKYPLTILIYEFNQILGDRYRKGVKPPADLTGHKRVVAGTSHFAEHCSSCHSAPGVVSGELAKGMYPQPPVLTDAASQWSSGERFWIIRNGIKMSGMPGWPDHSDEDIWNIVAFLGRLPAMTETDYGNLVKESLKAGGHATHGGPPADQECAPEHRAAGHC